MSQPPWLGRLLHREARRTRSWLTRAGEPRSSWRALVLVLLAVVLVFGIALAARVQRSVQAITSATDVRPAATRETTTGRRRSPTAAEVQVEPTPVATGSPAPTADAATVTAPTPTPTAAVAVEDQATPLLEAPFNVLLIGVDRRVADPEAGVRSDTLIVVHVDPVREWASLLSIPRDSVAAIPSGRCATAARTKINAAYACGWQHPEIYGLDATPISRQDAGAALAAQTVEAFLGLTIDYTAQVDFRGFEALIDAVGGITVDVPAPIVDAAYPTETYGTMRLAIPAGRQRMDGVTALRYVRTRHADNDFGRAARQQQVLQAVLDEVTGQHMLDQLRTLSSLLDVAATSVRTTLPIDLRDLGSLGRLATLGTALRGDRIVRLQLTPERTAQGRLNVWSDEADALVWDAAYVRRMARRLQQPPAGLATTAMVQPQDLAVVADRAAGVGTVEPRKAAHRHE